MMIRVFVPIVRVTKRIKRLNYKENGRFRLKLSGAIPMFLRRIRRLAEPTEAGKTAQGNPAD